MAEEACPAALPAQHVRSRAASQVSLQLPKCVHACCRVVGALCSVARAVNQLSSRADFKEAEVGFKTILAVDPYRLDDMEILSNILYVGESRPQLSFLAHKATSIDKYRPETCCIIGVCEHNVCADALARNNSGNFGVCGYERAITTGNYYSLRGEHEKAVISFGRALTIDR